MDGLDEATTRRGRTALLVLLAAFVLGPLTIGRELLPPDEPRFALVAREMWESGDVVVLTRGGTLYTDKPPLLFWCQAALFALAGGPGETTARLPSLLATLALVAALHRLSRGWYGEPHATRIVLCFVSISLVLQRGAWASTDALLAATVFIAIALGVRLRDQRHRGQEALAGAMLALGTLAKGPIAIGFVLMAALASALAGARVFSLRPFARPFALAAFLLVALPWPLAWIARQGAGALVDVFWRQNVLRYVDSWDNLEPWWYFALSYLIDMLPWSLVGWAALLPRVRRALVDDHRTRWLLAFVAIAIVFFSIPAGKRGVYLLPCYPAIAILFARTHHAVLADRLARRLAAIAPALVGLLVAGATLAVVALGTPPLPEALAEEPAIRRGVAALLALASTAMLALALATWRGSTRAFLAPAILAVGSGAIAIPLLAPAIDAGQKARPFAARVAPAIPEDAALAFTRTKWEVMSWYLGRTAPRLDDPAAVARFLEGPGRRAVLGKVEEVGAQDGWPEGTEVVLVERLGRANIALLTRCIEDCDAASIAPRPPPPSSSGSIDDRVSTEPSATP